jgi:hypothetical protein
MKNPSNHKPEMVPADPARRRAALADCTRQRNVLFVAAVVATVSALITRSKSPHNLHALALISLGAVLLWIIVFRLESQRRALTPPDRGDSGKDEPPKA